jgi:hypothetical protein
MSTFSLVLDGNLCFHRSRSPLLLLLVVLLPLLLVTTLAAVVSTGVCKQRTRQKNQCFTNIRRLKGKPGLDGWEMASLSDVAVVVIGSEVTDSFVSAGADTASDIGVASIGFSAVDSSPGTNS